MKAKIKNSNKVEYSVRPQEFNAYINTEEGKLKGVVTISNTSETIYADFDRRLTGDERIALLKEIFYVFCVKHESKVDDSIEAYSFVDLMNNEESDEDAEKTIIIKELLENKIDLSEERKKERLLYNVNWSVNIVKNALKEGLKEKALQPTVLSSKEASIYEKMLVRVLNMYGVEIRLVSIPFISPYPRYMNYIYIRQYKFICK